MERHTTVDFARIDLAVKPHRVPELVCGRDTSGATVVDGAADRDQVAVKKVDVQPIDLQPPSSVNAGSPCAQRSHKPWRPAIVEVTGCSIKSGQPKRPARVVV